MLEDENDLASLQLAYDAYLIPEKEDALRLLRQSSRGPKFGIDVAFAMNVTNIELCVDMRNYNILSTYESDKDHPLVASISHLLTQFGASQPVRQSCRVVIDRFALQYSTPYERWSSNTASEIRAEFLTTFVGFKVLIVVISTVAPEHLKRLRGIDTNSMREHARTSELLSFVKEKLKTYLQQWLTAAMAILVRGH